VWESAPAGVCFICADAKTEDCNRPTLRMHNDRNVRLFLDLDTLLALCSMSGQTAVRTIRFLSAGIDDREHEADGIGSFRGEKIRLENASPAVGCKESQRDERTTAVRSPSR